MVKNTKGGKGAKSMARKSFSTQSSEKTRFSKDPLEIYTIVTKLYGHGRCEVMDASGNTYMMHIRGKYRGGRGRRGNEVLLGVWCLSGVRSYESSGENVDLLCVYEERDVLELKSEGIVLGGGGGEVGGEVGGEGWEYGEELLEEVEEVEVERVKEDEEVNIDEI